MLHGYGDQQFLKKSYEEDRQKALLDNSLFTTTELNNLGVSGSKGGGETDVTKTEIWQFPFPIDSSVRPRKKVNIRDVDPTIGEMSD